MEFYLVLFSINYFFSIVEIFTKINKKTKRFLLCISSALFVILSTFYYGPLGDRFSYEDWFYKTDISHIYDLSKNNFEYFYEVIQALVKASTNDYVALRFVLAVFCMALQYNIVNHREDGQENLYPLSFLLILWSLNFGNIFIIRSTIASLICLISIRYIIKRKLGKFLLCVVVAALFHRIAILWFCAYFLYDMIFLRKYICIAIVFAFFMQRYLPQILLKLSSMLGASIHHKISNYLSYGILQKFGANYDSKFLLLKASVNAFFIIFICLFLIVTVNESNEKEKLRGLFNIFLFGFFLQVCSFQTSLAIARMATPFISIQFFILLKLMTFKYRKMYDRILVHACLSFYLLLRMVVFANSAGYDSLAFRF